MCHTTHISEIPDELAELMACSDPERRGVASKTVERQDTGNDGKEESTADDTPGRTQAGSEKFGENLVPTNG